MQLRKGTLLDSFKFTPSPVTNINLLLILSKHNQQKKSSMSITDHQVEQGWHSGESTRLPPMWPGFKSRHRCHMWVEFVVGFLPCSERFFSGYSGFPLSSKTNISKFQFDQESGRRRTTMWMCYLQIIIYLFINALIF